MQAPLATRARIPRGASSRWQPQKPGNQAYTQATFRETQANWAGTEGEREDSVGWPSLSAERIAVDPQMCVPLEA